MAQPRDPPVAFPDDVEAIMTQRHRRQRHLFTLWGRKARSERERILEEAQRRDEAEQDVARSRVLELAAGWDGPTWGGPTRQYPTVRPLLTRGQAARSSGRQS